MNNHDPQDEHLYGTNRYAQRMCHFIRDPFARQAFTELHDADWQRSREGTARHVPVTDFLKALDEFHANTDALWNEFECAS